MKQGSQQKSLSEKGQDARPNLDSSIAIPERFPVGLRAYVLPSRSKGRSSRRDAGPSRWSLIFDTETTVDATQRCRFGTYQIREHDQLREKGLFYDPKVLKSGEQVTIKTYARSKKLKLRTVSDFIEEVFFGVGYDFRANIIGFNLPFDISRMATDWDTARTRRDDVSMRGGFTFRLSRSSWRPRVVVNHVSSSLSFFRFAGAEPKKQARRGYFVDVRTIASALTGQKHTLESLADELGVEHRKSKTEEHGKTLSPKYIDYGLQDVAATWDCYVALRNRFKSHRLNRTPLHKLFSEASLGKAYLQEMGIKPWRECQPKFPPEITGIIMSTFYGGRAEIHLRRAIGRVLYCDFTSMYPTVCTLMRMWDFITADSMTWRDSTTETQELLRNVTLADLQTPAFWQGIHTIVQVEPNADIFPVRAKYDDQARGSQPEAPSQFTIGLNYLTSDFPLWFTLADCIAAKLLTGKSPKVLQSYTFSPGKQQTQLWPIDIIGSSDYHVDPRIDDFYKTLIDLRMATQERQRRATGAAKAKFDTEQYALKILANATSYGIFVELNVDDLPENETLQRFGASAKGEPIPSDKKEEPGSYFHPLVGTLITGAARLMLAIAETLVKQHGLDWAFCDTDSMAIMKPAHMSDAEFYKQSRAICDWFVSLNPYTKSVPIFKIEEENEPLGDKANSGKLEPLFCYAVSSKRYALFNIDDQGQPVLRKASAHGLGHWLPPYLDDVAPREFPSPVTKLEGVRRWQHDIWRRIITAALAERATEMNPAAHMAFDKPVASQYHATTPSILKWFETYNATRPFEELVRPFNFLLAFQIDPTADGLLNDDDVAVGRKRRKGRALEKVKPVAPYDSNSMRAARKCIDRQTGIRISIADLETYRGALAQYHLYPESKFLNGRHLDRGLTVRRHVKIGVADIHYIGKEANELEEQLFLGFDSEALPDYGMESEAYAELRGIVQHAVNNYALPAINQATGISERHLRTTRSNVANVTLATLRRIERALPEIVASEGKKLTLEQQWRDWARAECDRIGLRAFAKQLRVDHSNLAKIIAGERPIPRRLMARFVKLSSELVVGKQATRSPLSGVKRT